ncbi:MAG: tRNA (adenine-N1)-methyltransferase [bacterium]
MSLERERVIEGELIILYGGIKDKYMIEYRPGFEKSIRLGLIKLPEEVHYGDRVITNTGRLIYILKPTTAELIMNIKRKTTIVYPKDIGYILLEMGVCSGSFVAEVGSGSGGMTVALASVVGREGRVYSFDRNEEFLNNTRLNISRYNLDDRCEFILRDVATYGFDVYDLDAVFIDISEPWTVVSKTYESLKPGRVVSSISPNIEQVKKMRYEMEVAGFVDIRTSELLMRDILVRDVGTRPGQIGITHTGYLTFGRKINK